MAGEFYKFGDDLELARDLVDEDIRAAQFFSDPGVNYVGSFEEALESLLTDKLTPVEGSQIVVVATTIPLFWAVCSEYEADPSDMQLQHLITDNCVGRPYPGCCISTHSILLIFDRENGRLFIYDPNGAYHASHEKGPGGVGDWRYWVFGEKFSNTSAFGKRLESKVSKYGIDVVVPKTKGVQVKHGMGNPFVIAQGGYCMFYNKYLAEKAVNAIAAKPADGPKVLQALYKEATKNVAFFPRKCGRGESRETSKIPSDTLESYAIEQISGLREKSVKKTTRKRSRKLSITRVKR